MLIDTDTLLAYGATPKKWYKGEQIFAQENEARYFHQIDVGSVKMTSLTNDGKEFIQGVFHEGHSFGEPALWLQKPYPASAYAITDSLIYRLTREKFLHLLDDHPPLFKRLFAIFAERLYCKTLTANILVNNSPEEKLVAFLLKIKNENKLIENGLVPFTRQQLADFTGLRVETVIRTLVKLSESNKVKIIDHKLYFR
ncbi:Crp/Fnr family transcriptional regulator [Sediminibacterium sp. TEGAF015]|uniref:Crp/Fnr family transcriptional regulator n=1 Tax=Sediminibacterium sp. TEGAF015 TaxID=575378 RepID=UPI002206C69B|nr:Crp/Fnr family transcriptional regulator [Sediminibacterium sp. TEGAF015]BDQ11155.1 transcriptional regulator [Sediminibacterium sp. TEGAF015]